MFGRADFRFHPVGHGLFYSGELCALEARGVPFTFVYDCGGRGAAKSFERFWKPYGKEKNRLDLLIISHFHLDHIGGVPSLIECARPRRMVLPYLYPEEKIASVATLLSEFRWGIQKEALSRFILGPRTYCGKESDCRAVIVDRDEMIASDRVDERLQENAGFSNELRFSQEAVLKSSGGHISVRNGAVGVVDQWVFKFFMPKVAANYGDIKDWMDEEGISGEWLDEEVKLDEVYEKIKKRFRDPRLKLKQNVSNLVCVHGPRAREYDKRTCVITGNRFERVSRLFLRQRSYAFGCVQPPCGVFWQMLTGDAEFDATENFANLLSNDECDQIVLFQVPHHGSPNNREEWFERVLPNCLAWVVPHGRSWRDRKNTFDADESQGGRTYYVKDELRIGLKI